MQHFISVSGGKDSAAVACLAIERQARGARYVFADTGNEHPITIEHVAYMAHHLGITIETVKADFSAAFAKRREELPKWWGRPGRAGKSGEPTPAVPQHLIERAQACLIPSGIPFLDLCMLKGRFPGVKSRFCTEDLKLRPMDEQLKVPLLANGATVVEWIGERAEESPGRARKPTMEKVEFGFDPSTGKPLRFPGLRVLYRPIHGLKVPKVFAIAKRHGLKPNPLYLQGMNRVGCMPCIMVKKGELREIARRFPEHIERISEWEGIVREVSRRGNATFLAAKTVPGTEGDDTRAEIHKAVEWANTSRGGWNFDIENVIEDQDAPSMCSSGYGLCE